MLIIIHYIKFNTGIFKKIRKFDTCHDWVQKIIGLLETGTFCLLSSFSLCAHLKQVSYCRVRLKEWRHQKQHFSALIMIRYTIITGILKSGIFTLFGTYYEWIQKNYRLFRKRHFRLLSSFSCVHILSECRIVLVSVRAMYMENFPRVSLFALKKNLSIIIISSSNIIISESKPSTISTRRRLCFHHLSNF